MGSLQGELKGYILPGSREQPLDSLCPWGPGLWEPLRDKWSTPTLAPGQEVQRVPAGLEDSDQATVKGPSAEDRLQPCGLSTGLPRPPTGSGSLAEAKKPGAAFLQILWNEVHQGGLSPTPLEYFLPGRSHLGGLFCFYATIESIALYKTWYPAHSKCLVDGP